MLNIGGGEILVIALVALIVVGPEQLPGVLRKAGRYASQVRSMTSSIRDEFMSGIDEVDPTKWSNDIDGRGDGSADKPIVPRGYSDRHDEMRRPEATSATGDPSHIKPKTAQMASVDPEPETGTEADTSPEADTGTEAVTEVAASEPVRTEADTSEPPGREPAPVADELGEAEPDEAASPEGGADE